MPMRLIFNNDDAEDDFDFEIALRCKTTGGEESAGRGSNAIALLSRVAEYMRRGQPVPTTLAVVVVNAFEETARASHDDRSKVLLRELGLVHDNRPPKHP